jgi:CubicO group peptidase (beta-lactamase class C family)
MKDTYFSVQEVSKDPTLSLRLAKGYTWDVGSNTYVAEPYMNDVAVTGAGAMVSNVLEYTKWLRAMIYQTGPISPEGHAALIQPRTVITDMSDLVAPPAPHQLYALGWFIHSYRGEPLYWHSGSWAGFGIMVGFLPSKGFGFAMMSNTVNGRHAEVEIFLHLLDQISGGPAIPRTIGQGHVAGPRGKAMPDAETMSEAMKRLYPCLPNPPIPHSLPLHQYAGRYEHPGFGSITVDMERGSLGANLLDRVTAGIMSFQHASGVLLPAKVHWDV